MGEVLRAPKKSGFKKGDKVTGFPEVACGKCSACRAGRLVHCPEFKFVGSRLPGGCFCERVAVHYSKVFRLPKAMEDEVGAMIEPTAVAVHAVKKAGVLKGLKTVVIGGGPIGLLTAQVARAFGSSKVMISEPIGKRREIAQILGFPLVCNPQKEDLPSFAKKNLGLVDIVFDIVATQRTVEESIAALRPGGTLVLVGLPHVEGLGIPYLSIFAKELQVFGTRTYFMEDFPEAIRLLSVKKVKVKPIISAVSSLGNFTESLDLLEKVPEKYLKILITPGR
jgi:L-iditol 2-dehydrogenase